MLQEESAEKDETIEAAKCMIQDLVNEQASAEGAPPDDADLQAKLEQLDLERD